MIEIDLYELTDLFEKYNRKKVSKELIDYMICEVKHLKLNSQFKVIINNKLNAEVDFVHVIKKGLLDEYNNQKKKHYYIGFSQVMYLILGIALLFLSMLISDFVFREIILIFAWVFIWSMGELEIFSDVEGKKKKHILKKLLNAEYIVNK